MLSPCYLVKKKKTLSRDEKSDLVFKEKVLNFMRFLSFVRYKMNSGIDSVMRPIHIYLALPKVYPKKYLYSMRQVVINSGVTRFKINSIFIK